MSGKKKIENSIYWATVVSSVNSGMEAPEIYKLLNEDKGYKVNLAAVRRAVQKVKRDGPNALLLENDAKAALMQMDQKISDAAPNMSDIMSRRMNLLKNIIDRKQLLIDAQKEGDRTIVLRKMIEDLANCENISEREQKKNIVLRYVSSNFSNAKMNPSIEAIIRQYTMDTHDIFKYVEQFIDKYDVCNLIEKMSINVAKAAIDVFSKYIVKETEEERNKIISSFKSKVNQCLDDIKEKNLGIIDQVYKNEGVQK